METEAKKELMSEQQLKKFRSIFNAYKLGVFDNDTLEDLITKFGEENGFTLTPIENGVTLGKDLIINVRHEMTPKIVNRDDPSELTEPTQEVEA